MYFYHLRKCRFRCENRNKEMYNRQCTNNIYVISIFRDGWPKLIILLNYLLSFDWALTSTALNWMFIHCSLFELCIKLGRNDSSDLKFEMNWRYQVWSYAVCGRKSRWRIFYGPRFSRLRCPNTGQPNTYHLLIWNSSYIVACLVCIVTIETFIQQTNRWCRYICSYF